MEDLDGVNNELSFAETQYKLWILLKRFNKNVFEPLGG